MADLDERLQCAERPSQSGVMVMDHVFPSLEAETCSCGEKGNADKAATLGALVRATNTAIEVPVAEFEGEWIRQMHGVLPTQTVEMPVGYARGTHLKFEIEVRVRDIAIKEIKGELTRVHTFAIEDRKVHLVGAYSADELDPGVGGSAAAGAEEEDDDA